MEFDISPLYYMSVGAYICAALLLGLALGLGVFKLRPAGGQTPPMRLAGIALLVDVVPTSLHVVQKAFLPDSPVFWYIFPFTDLLVTSLFILAGMSLVSGKYPSATALRWVGLSALSLYVVFLLTGSQLIFSVLTIMWIICLILLVVNHVRKYNQSLSFHYSNVDSHRKTWFLYILLWAFVVYPVYKVFSLGTVGSDVFYIIYALSQVALYVILSRNVSVQTTTENEATISLQEFVEETDGSGDSTTGAGLSASDFFPEDQQQKMLAELTKMMEEEKLYRNPELCVDDLVKRFGTNASYFYYFMRDVVNASFFDYVNSYRIEEAKGLLLKGEKVDLLAEAVGYNSANTFRRAFKKITGLTPSEWRQSQG